MAKTQSMESWHTNPGHMRSHTESPLADPNPRGFGTWNLEPELPVGVTQPDSCRSLKQALVCALRVWCFGAWLPRELWCLRANHLLAGMEVPVRLYLQLSRCGCQVAELRGPCNLQPANSARNGMCTCKPRELRRALANRRAFGRSARGSCLEAKSWTTGALWLTWGVPARWGAVELWNRIRADDEASFHWLRVKIKQATAEFSGKFHLPGFHFEYLFFDPRLRACRRL